jgi:Spy/CpxP family protein refolding chaperone
VGQDPANAQNRAILEQRVRQMLAQMARRQLGLNDEQVRQLRGVDQRFEQQRRQLQREEQQTRRALRFALQDSANRDTAKVSQQISQLIQFQRRRADLLDAEQKELAAFLTPMQRGKYLGLQEQVRRRVEQQLQGVPGGRGLPPGAPPPGARPPL